MQAPAKSAIATAIQNRFFVCLGFLRPEGPNDVGEGAATSLLLPANLLFLAAIRTGDQVRLGLDAPRSHARPEAKKRITRKGRELTGSDGIGSVKLGLQTAVVLSHDQR
jgi:hypothetical protein